MQAAVAVKTHHDQVGVALLRGLEDPLCGSPFLARDSTPTSCGTLRIA